MSAPAPSRLDAGQVLQGSFDEATGRLRTDAIATIGDVDIDVSLDPAEDGVFIADKDSGNKLKVEADGSINTQDTQAHLLLTLIDNDLTTLNSVDFSTSAKQDVANSSLSSIDSKLTTVDSNIANINAKLPILGQQVAASSLSVVLASNQPAIDTNVQLDAFTKPTVDNAQIVGSLDGTKTGTKYGFVNNLRQQILASHDREQLITYADFGTKNQRITQVDYVSVTFPGVTARKTITYTLVGNLYRRDSIDWSIV